jgi:hypothetical protein
MKMSRRARTDTKNGNTKKMLKTGVKVGSCCAIPLLGTVVVAKKVIPKVTAFAKEKLNKNSG